MESLLEENELSSTMTSNQSLSKILEKALGRARTNGRIGTVTRNLEDATLLEKAQLFLKGGRVVESGEEVFTLTAELEALDSSLWNVAAISIFESFNPMSLGLNVINIYWIYLSIASLEDQLAQVRLFDPLNSHSVTRIYKRWYNILQALKQSNMVNNSCKKIYRYFQKWAKFSNLILLHCLY